MTTLVCTQPGHFEYRSAATPAPMTGHAIIKIKRIGVCGTDYHAFAGRQPFFEYPRILGHELAGELVDIDGDNEGSFRLNQPVTFVPYFSCGYCIACRRGHPNCCVRIQVCGVHRDGGMAEYLSVPVGMLIGGDGLTLDELALVEPLSIAAHGVQKASIEKDEFVLVVGAGPIGIATMEFAGIAGGKVIALDVNDNRLNFCSSHIKVPHTINAAKEDVMQRLSEITGADMPTVIIDATGNLEAINRSFYYLAHSGRYILIGLQKAAISVSHPEFHKREAHLMSSRNATRADFEFVIASIKQRQIDASAYITHRAPFAEVSNQFEYWSQPTSGVIKAIIDMP